jgi:energy-coupling factor transporter transmembrane protein EcfT
MLTFLFLILWIFIIYLVVSSFSYISYWSIFAIFFAMIFFFLFVGYLFVDEYNKQCKVKKHGYHHHHLVTSSKTFNVKSSDGATIFLWSDIESPEDERRQTVKVVINGSECESNNSFTCTSSGISKVFNVALPKLSDDLELSPQELDSRIELIEFTSPEMGTVFRIAHTITKNQFSVDVVTEDGVEFTGSIRIDGNFHIESSGSKVINA